MRFVAVAAVVATMVLAPLGAAARQSSGDLRTAVSLVKKKGNRPDTSTWDGSFRLNALIGTLAQSDGYNRRAFFFLGRRYLGTDASAPSAGVAQLWRDDRTIAFLYVLYRANEPLCCPTGGGKIVRFRWTGTRIVALDRIPPTSGRLHR